MIDKPNTLKIDVLEWKMLSVQSVARLADGINAIGEHLNKQSVVNPQMLGELDAFWANARAAIDRQWAEVQVRLKGWEQHSRPMVAEWEAQQKLQQTQPQPFEHKQYPPQEQLQPIVEAAKEQITPKRGGWPKGQKRGPRKAKVATSSAAALPPVTQ